MAMVVMMVVVPGAALTRVVLTTTWAVMVMMSVMGVSMYVCMSMSVVMVAVLP